MSHSHGHGHSHENTVPRPALIMAGVLVGFCLLMTAAVSLGFIEREAVPSVERASANVSPVTERSLRFFDEADGTVRIADVASGETVAVVDTETKSGGFVRGVLRGLARERRAHGIGSEPPFALTLWENGAISLTDSATGRMIELGAFGPDNRAVFAALLPPEAVLGNAS
ncbi:MAG: phosphonoacetaldehyde methylase [Erythrobacter sp.]|nr:MAG: phosphonoacetaldehyde methylase [Erythrobacter sp.]